MPLVVFFLSVIYICLPAYASQPVVHQTPIVHGSIIAECGNFLLHTPPSGNSALEISPTITVSEQTLDSANRTCLKTPSELLAYCRQLYASGNHSAVVGVVAGPSMFPLSTKMGQTRLLRPYWCLSTFEHQPALHTPSNCQLSRLPAASPPTGGNLSTPRCLSQPEWEIQARTVCHKDPSRHLFSAYPIGPCDIDTGSIEALRLFSGLEFVCCGQATGDAQNRFYHTEVELSLAFDLTASAVEVKGEDPTTSQLTALHQSTVQKQSKFEEQFLRLMRTTDDRRRQLENMWASEAFRLAHDAHLKIYERIEAINETLSNARRQLEKLWEDDKAEWIRLENAEHSLLDADFEPEDKASEEEFEYTLQEPQVQIDRIQTALARLLTAMTFSVQESVRHLNAIRQHVPWYLLAPAVSTSSKTAGDTKADDAFIGQSANLTVLGQIQRELVDHVAVAGSAIQRLNAVMGRVFREGKPAEYSANLRAAYKRLSDELNTAKTAMTEAKELAWKQMRQLVSGDGGNLIDVDKFAKHWALFSQTLAASRDTAWRNESHRREWLEATQYLDRLLMDLQQYTTKDTTTSVEYSHVYGLIATTLVIFVSLLSLLIFFGCYLCVCVRPRASLLEPAAAPSEAAAAPLPSLSDRLMNRFKSSLGGLRPAGKGSHYRAFHHLPVTVKSSASYQPIREEILNTTSSSPLPPPPPLTPVSQNRFGNGLTTAAYADFSSPTIDQYTRNLVIRGYENPTYRLTDE
ncbi:Amyloid-like protein 2 [Sparganum proliferum]